MADPKVTVESLQATVDSNKLLLDENAKTIENLGKQLEEKDSLLEQKDKEIDDMKKLISSGKAVAKDAPEKSSVAKIPTDLVDHGDKKYKWKVASFHLRGKARITAEEASTDEELIAKIISIPGQNILQEQE